MHNSHQGRNIQLAHWWRAARGKQYKGIWKFVSDGKCQIPSFPKETALVVSAKWLYGLPLEYRHLPYLTNKLLRSSIRCWWFAKISSRENPKIAPKIQTGFWETPYADLSPSAHVFPPVREAWHFSVPVVTCLQSSVVGVRHGCYKSKITWVTVPRRYTWGPSPGKPKVESNSIEEPCLLARWGLSWPAASVRTAAEDKPAGKRGARKTERSQRRRTEGPKQSSTKRDQSEIQQRA